MRSIGLVVASAGFAAVSQAAWVPFSNKTGQFSVLLPAKPKSLAASLSKEAGSSMPVFLATGKDAVGGILSIETKTLNANRLETAEDTVLAGMLLATHATQTSRAPYTLHGYHGVKVEFSMAKGSGTMWVFPAKGHLYLLTVASKTDSVLPAARSKMFGSFRAL